MPEETDIQKDKMNSQDHKPAMEPDIETGFGEPLFTLSQKSIYQRLNCKILASHMYPQCLFNSCFPR